MAVVFRSFHRTRTFRFFEPYRERKHGNPRPLEALIAQLFHTARIPPPSSSGGDAI